MGKKPKVSYEDKIKACQDYISGKASAKQIAEELNLGKGGDTTITRWVRKYRSNDPESLMPKLKNNSYTGQSKNREIQAVSY